MLHRFVIAILLLIACGSLQAQNLDKLDKANGFKEFKFDKPKTKWEDDVKETKSGAYRYTGKNAPTAFGSSVNKLYLKFDTLGKLSGVYISVKGLMGKGGVRGYKKIIGLAYGKESKLDDGEKEVTYYWKAQHVNLVLYAWDNGSTWDAELHFTTPEQSAADSAVAKNKAAD